MYAIILVAWMYLTPIIYPIDILPELYKQWIVRLNPMFYLVELFRNPLYYGVFLRQRVPISGQL
jgi:ABC-type polysaccharide/polyol phosphate export permease